MSNVIVGKWALGFALIGLLVDFLLKREAKNVAQR